MARLPTDSGDRSAGHDDSRPLDSTYLFGRRADDVAGWPRAASRRGRRPETPLRPYDNVLIMRQPGWE